jgi:hypothetical protein
MRAILAVAFTVTFVLVLGSWSIHLAYARPNVATSIDPATTSDAAGMPTYVGL